MLFKIPYKAKKQISVGFTTGILLPIKSGRKKVIMNYFLPKRFAMKTRMVKIFIQSRGIKPRVMEKLFECLSHFDPGFRI